MVGHKRRGNKGRFMEEVSTEWYTWRKRWFLIRDFDSQHLPTTRQPEDGALYLSINRELHVRAHVRVSARPRRRAAVCLLSSPVVLPPCRCSALLLARPLSLSLSLPSSLLYLASSSFSPVSSTSLSSSSLRMPQPCTPAPASRQMVVPSPATLDAGRSEKAHSSVLIWAHCGLTWKRGGPGTVGKRGDAWQWPGSHFGKSSRYFPLYSIGQRGGSCRVHRRPCFLVHHFSTTCILEECAGGVKMTFGFLRVCFYETGWLS